MSRGMLRVRLGEQVPEGLLRADMAAEHLQIPQLELECLRRAGRIVAVPVRVRINKALESVVPYYRLDDLDHLAQTVNLESPR
ncbi:hypothetical protein AB4305_29995 [Nocardia sp. 2YAB30]|uniref:hypothetical protein n=1 Tax=Nocardia sp. 2YAB30 TaxID=3233022 RepID=UPI003F977E43